MNSLRHSLTLATAVAVVLTAAPLRAQDTVKTNPGFNPDTGQINPGEAKAAPSASIDVRKIPTHAEALAALRTVDDPNPALGAEAPQQSTSGNDKTVSPAGGGGDPTTATQGQAAIGGPLSPGASAGGNAPGGSAAATSDQEQSTPSSRATFGARPASTAGAKKPGPIGATGQTMPSKFSERNDVLDRLPIMAMPLRLSDEERQQIYKAVMSDSGQAAADADKLTPASELSPDQALNGMHPLPGSVSGIEALNKLAYVKGKSKVLLVIPTTRTVVDEIES